MRPEVLELCKGQAGVRAARSAVWGPRTAQGHSKNCRVDDPEQLQSHSKDCSRVTQNGSGVTGLGSWWRGPCHLRSGMETGKDELVRACEFLEPVVSPGESPEQG